MRKRCELSDPLLRSPVVSFDPTLLTRIMLGKDMKSEHRSQIHEWADVRNPALLVTEVEYDAIEQILKLIQ